MMLRVPNNPGEVVYLDSEPLDGVFLGMTISREKVTDDKQRGDRSGTSKRTKGFADAEVRIQLSFPGKDPYEQIRSVQSRFVQLDGRGQSQPVLMVHPHVQAYGLKLVTFLRLSTAERNTSTVLTGALEFAEWRPLPKVISREKLKALQRLGLLAKLEIDYWGRHIDEAKTRVGGAVDKYVAVVGGQISQMESTQKTVENYEKLQAWVAPAPVTDGQRMDTRDTKPLVLPEEQIRVSPFEDKAP